VTNEQIDRFERNRKNFILSAQNSKDDTWYYLNTKTSKKRK
jgi:hypothetical protein